VVVEAAPPAPFIITQAEILLEFLIIKLDPPAQFGQVDQPIEGNFLGQGSEPILGRLGLVFQPLDRQPLFGARLVQLVSRCAARTRWRAKREDSRSALPSRQATVSQASVDRLRASALALIG
jgi:hypothetical protein